MPSRRPRQENSHDSRQISTYRVKTDSGRRLAEATNGRSPYPRSRKLPGISCGRTHSLNAATTGPIPRHWLFRHRQQATQSVLWAFSWQSCLMRLTVLHAPSAQPAQRFPRHLHHLDQPGIFGVAFQVERSIRSNRLVDTCHLNRRLDGFWIIAVEANANTR